MATRNPLPKKKPSKKFCNGRRSRADKYCRHAPGWGTDHAGEGRCKLHGGASLKGPDHPNWRHGARSKYVKRLPELLAPSFVEAAENDDPLSLRDEIALTDALIMRYLENVKAGSAKGGGYVNIKSVYSDLAPLIDQRRKLVREEVRTLATMHDVIFKDRQILIMKRLIGIATTVLAGRPELLTMFSDQVLEMAGGSIEEIK